jgi:hypothetical protein
MFRIHPRTLLKAALVPTALLMAAVGSPAAFASHALEHGRRVHGHRHRDDAEQRSHRHLRAARRYDQRTLTGAARGVPDDACTARAPALLPGPKSFCLGQQRRRTDAPAQHRRRRR